MVFRRQSERGHDLVGRVVFHKNPDIVDRTLEFFGQPVEYAPDDLFKGFLIHAARVCAEPHSRLPRPSIRTTVTQPRPQPSTSSSPPRTVRAYRQSAGSTTRE